MKKLFFLLIILSSLMPACQRHEGHEGEAQPVVSVKVAKVEQRDIAETATAFGTVFPREQATISAKVSAPIARMELLKNKPVNAGQIIAVLESRDLKAAVAEAKNALHEAQVSEQQVVTGNIPQTMAQNQKTLQDAEANVNNARALYNRRLTLYEQGGIAKKELEAAQLALETAENELKLAQQEIQLRKQHLNPTDKEIATSRAAQAQDKLKNAEAQLSYTTIRSPITGTVTDQFQYQGEFAASGARLATIMDLSEVIVKAQIPENVASHLKIGDTANVSSVDLPDQTIAGRVSLISKTVDPTNRAVEVWVRAPNKTNQLRPGSSAKITVTTSIARNVLAVPIKAVTFESPTDTAGTVMVVDKDSVAHSTQVNTGIRQEEFIEIISGLSGGETVVIEGNYQLQDKARVQVEEANGSKSAKSSDEKSSDEKGDAKQ